MTPGKTKVLIDIYPKLFQHINAQCPMALFYFECGNGWFELLKELIEGIKAICERKGIETRASQVKEKYGSLRFYMETETDEISKLIEIAEEKSSNTCESCGAQGKIKRSGVDWYYCSCDACMIEQ